MEFNKKIHEKYKTEIIPVDSEHFAISELLKLHNLKEIEKIIITVLGTFPKFK